ncbi:hypothetical protein Cs7R123_32690 [Catellatospora sp. TT07R-123]|uniref:DUF4007 family protein n=1 Tax=Catellatospora sp. TT07R-123 TaxID=2733863 RepID=UPI001B0F779E|nr:DUF4007 family protein [Catellatospora sp. TT07R-123]GHJ45927.1 hypothetical protein Cs7R123_32690 [Catellatospora sp. TT07R-123]
MIDTKLRDVAEFSFARHETFAPRFGWLHKAYSSLTDPNVGAEVFLRNDAPVVLGVGKNMVNAIRFWSNAFKVSIEYPKAANIRAFESSPLWEARWLLDEEGADPYLEDTASLWLLHWWLLAPPCYVPTWWIAFHAMPTSRFTEASLTEIVVRNVRLAGWEPPALASIERDVDCLTKMYARRRTNPLSPGSFEDLLDCPFRELGLLEAVAADVNEHSKTPRAWQFTTTARSSLPALVLAYACLDYAARNDGFAKGGSISLARLAHEPGGPGRAFRVREPEIAAALEQAAARHKNVTLTEGLGQRSLTFKTDPKALAWDLLDAHYGGIRKKHPTPTARQWYADHPGAHDALQTRQAGRGRQLATVGGQA